MTNVSLRYVIIVWAGVHFIPLNCVNFPEDVVSITKKYVNFQANWTSLKNFTLKIYIYIYKYTLYYRRYRFSIKVIIISSRQFNYKVI